MHDYSSLLIKAHAQLFRDKIKEFEEATREEKQYITKWYSVLANSLKEKEWQYNWVIDNAKKRVINYEKQRKRFIFFLDLCLGKASKSTINIEQIKEQGDPELLLGKAKVRNQRTLFFLCVFHNETKPSLAWYKKSPHYYCFSCGAHGDIIDLAMKVFNVDFKEACRKLSP